MYLVGHDGNIHLLRPNGRGLGVSNLSRDCGFYCFETKDLFSSLRMVGWVVGQKKGAFFVNVMNRWLLWGNGKWSGAWQTIKTNRIKLWLFIQRYTQFSLFEKDLGIISQSHCVYHFQAKNVSMLHLSTNQISLSNCLYFLQGRHTRLNGLVSWDVGQCILQLFVSQFVTSLQLFVSQLWRHKSWNQPYRSNQAVFIRDQKVKTNIWISWERKEH